MKDMPKQRIKVPDVPGPRAQLCWLTPPLDGSKGDPMLHCDRAKDHLGPHSWACAQSPKEPQP